MRADRKILILFLPIYMTLALEPNYTLPPITYTTPEQERQEARQRGRRLMELKGIMGGDSILTCTNWVCPASIVVNAVRYDVVTNRWDEVLEFEISTTNVPSEKIAIGDVRIEASSSEARVSAFTSMSYTSMPIEQYARHIWVQPIDILTNMMFVTNIYGDPTDRRQLVYRNIRVRYEVTDCAIDSPATNALAFTAALINAGLPEEERIPLSATP